MAMGEPAPSSPIVAVSAVLPEDGYSPEEADLDERLLQQDRPRLLRALVHTELFDQENVRFVKPLDDEGPDWIDAYRDEEIHSPGLLDFFQTAWSQWEEETGEETPLLYPSDFGLPRIAHLRPSRNVVGRMGYYCTDMGTPIYSELRQELKWDVLVMTKALEELNNNALVYAMPLHPGHHAAHDSFGGACYLNHAAFAAHRLQKRLRDKVAVLDLAYHCGNGTASILRKNADVMVASIHCHPDHGYPYHTGFCEDNDSDYSIHYFPIVPGKASCRDEHRTALGDALARVDRFGAKVVVVSMATNLRRFGFETAEAYHEMGCRNGAACRGLPCLVVQEGGDSEPNAGQHTASFLAGLSAER